VAAANAVLDVIAEEELCARASQIGAVLTARLTALSQRQGMEPIGNVRGLGAMVAFELVTSRDSREPDAALTQRIIAEAEARGLILLSCGTYGNVIRLLPPLTTPTDQVEEALDIIEAAVEAAIGAGAGAA
jgi:4-aminobutyrate aminotransferase/(S)-3-amino-2-methylpropionate transaminase